MILPKAFRNIYEESPDRLKELISDESEEKGSKPGSSLSREALLETHEQHLKNLLEGNVPVRNLILPLPYPPSRASLQESVQLLRLDDLRIAVRDPSSFIVLRTIASPYVYSSTVTIAEDEESHTTRVTICNLEDTMIDPIIGEGCVLAIKQPCWSKLVDGGYHIRVDHPSDLVLLKSDESAIPSSWRSPAVVDHRDATQWKKDGDMMFLKKRFRKALQLYDHGLDYLSRYPDRPTEIDLYRKRCGVNIVLLRLDDAANDLAKAIAAHAFSSHSISTSPLQEHAIVEAWLHSHDTEDPHQISANIPRALRELAARIKFDLGLYQNKPEYNLSLISSYVGPLTLHVDAPNYICDTEIRRTTGHGRGLFARKDFKAGDLLCAEKAFVLPGYFIQDKNSDSFLYSLGDGTAAPRPGALLFKELVQKLRWNPSLRKDYFELDDGGYWKQNGWDLAEGEEIPVDVFRVELIRRYNCFSVPTRSSDILKQKPNANPELRNGSWNHASYVNHSCLPNSVRTFIGDLHFLRATRDITAGEEITHQYIAPEIDIDIRQEKYRGTWSFECDCQLCKVDGSVDEAARRERLRLFEELKIAVMKLGERGTTVTSVKKIARGMREIEALYTPADPNEEDQYTTLPRLALVHPTLFLTEAWRSVKNVDKMIEYAHKLLRNFGIITKVVDKTFSVQSNAGMINVEAARALRYLAEGYTAKDEAELAEQCISLGKQWFVVITGAELGMNDFFRFQV